MKLLRRRRSAYHPPLTEVPALLRLEALADQTVQVAAEMRQLVADLRRADQRRGTDRD